MLYSSFIFIFVLRNEIEPGTGSQKSLKRNNYLSWDEYFMAIAFLSAQRSKDPKTQVITLCIKKKNVKA